MSPFAPPADLTRVEWETHLEYVTGLVDVYSIDTPDGRALDPIRCPGPLAARYDGLLVMGLERGWLSLDCNDQPTDSGEGP